LTTRIDESDVFSALSSSMHEGGHGMYEQGVNPALSRTPLAEGTSLGIHESQSRMWENQVGRSKAFWTHYFPQLQSTFPELQNVTLEKFYHGINLVQPSFIRVESDEVTYNLHILVRYEIEKALIEGQMKVDEIPDAWGAKMQEYLGITPNHDAEGALQDIHWSHGSFGYFPTYTLGNLYAAQFFNTAKQQIADLEGNIAKGQLLPLKNWLNKEIHWVGKMETAATIVQRVTGEPLNATYFVDYLWKKYGDIFSISRA
jgi:carboxypeptidase Taq